jgi:hypothetical protein
MALRHLDCVDRVPWILFFKKALLEILDAVMQIHFVRASWFTLLSLRFRFSYSSGNSYRS